MKIISLFIAFSIYITAFPQIKTIAPLTNSSLPKQKTNNAPPLSYDSLVNYLPQDFIQAYKGQKLVISPRRFETIGYTGFYSNLNTHKVYAPDWPNDNSSRYDSLAMREFIIDSVIGKYTHYLVLSDSIETIYYKYPQREENCVFIVEGYVKKMEQLYKNKRFVYVGPGTLTINPFTNNEEKLIPGRTYIFENLFIYDDSNIRILFRDDQGSHIMDYFHSLIPTSKYYSSAYIPEKEIKSMKQRYGSYWVDMAIKKTIQTGMPAQLVKFVLGEPNEINSSSYGPEQWCYSKSYIYIENGKVVSWQNFSN